MQGKGIMINVLMIDDEQVVLDVTRLYLERYGNISVDCVLSASKAIEKMQSCNYDLILCDYEMGEIDGISFLKAVRGLYPGVSFTNPDIPFIIFTGKGDECIVIEALNCGADFYIQKGDDPKKQLQALAGKIEDIVHRRCREEVMDAAFENTNTCMVIFDENDSVLRMNRQMSEIIQNPEKNTDNEMKWDFFVDEADHLKMKNFLSSLKMKRENNYKEKKSCSFYLCDKSGKQIPAFATASYIPEKKISVMSIRVE
ncbi:MAG: response regulator [Methanomicrobium sp.]|nr:response regulator [Methanomicrobium sp.]